MTVFRPASAGDVAGIIADAHGRAEPLAICGAGTKAGMGLAVRAPHTLDLSGLSGIDFYEPAELAIGAGAGTPLTAIEAALAGKGQGLAFDPPRYAALLGTGGEPTIGGMLAANLSGPRRISAGAARDFFLGVAFVNGTGEPVKSGGRVMKNVTGFDFCKLFAGSWGTLGAMTSVVLKTQPLQERRASLVWHGMAPSRGVELLSAALGSAYGVVAAAWTPDGRAVIEIEGFAPSVAYRINELCAELTAFGEPETLEAEASRALWADIRDVVPLLGDWPVVWRVSTAPANGPAVIERVAAAIAGQPAAMLDWAGGLVWLGLDADHAGDAVTAAAAALGGHATLFRAPADRRGTLTPFQPPDPAIAALQARVKAAFDPLGILNPGRQFCGK